MSQEANPSNGAKDCSEIQAECTEYFRPDAHHALLHARHFETHSSNFQHNSKRSVIQILLNLRLRPNKPIMS